MAYKQSKFQKDYLAFRQRLSKELGAGFIMRTQKEKKRGLSKLWPTKKYATEMIQIKGQERVSDLAFLITEGPFGRADLTIIDQANQKTIFRRKALRPIELRAALSVEMADRFNHISGLETKIAGTQAEQNSTKLYSAVARAERKRIDRRLRQKPML